MIDCIYCGKQFTAQRSTAKYCSDACKVAFNRMPQDNKNKYEIIRQNLITMSQNFRRDERLANDYDKMLGTLQALIIEQRQAINHNQLNLFDNEDEN